MTDIIAAIDVGTTKVCTLIAAVEGREGEESLRVIGKGVCPSRGMDKGRVVNVAQASDAIAQSVEEAEVAAEWPIRAAYVGVSDRTVTTLIRRAAISVSRSLQGVTAQDVERVLEAARVAAPLPASRTLIHTIPLRFSIDGQSGIRDPLGMRGDRLDVEVMLVTAATSSTANLVKCVEDYGLAVQGLVLEPLAAGEAVLTPEERELGVIVVDIGGGTTDMGVFLQNSLWHTVVREVGGDLFTNDLAVLLHAPSQIVEEIKIRHGHVQVQRISDEETLSLTGFGSGRSITVPRRVVAGILAARAEETLEMILTEIKRSGYDGVLPAGLVLCGGASMLPGLLSLSQNVLQLPVRIGSPNGLRGMTRDMASPQFATSVGLLKWGFRNHWHHEQRRVREVGTLDRVGGWLRNLLPG